MIEFRKNAARDKLYALAVENGVSVAEDADRDAIIAALTAHNEKEAAETTADGATEGAGSDADSGGTDNTTPGEKPEERPTEGAEDYDTFVYVGPSIPRGRLKENAVFRGTLSDVLAYLGDVVEQYPQIPRLIVPTNRLAAFSVKVKTPGNIAHKYYSDIASAIRKGKEV